MATTVTFNSYNLNDGTINTTQGIDMGGAPQRNVSIFNLARASGGVITNNFYGTKAINVNGVMFGTSMADLESKIDAFHAAMATQGKNLDVSYNSSTRRYVCTPTAVTVDRPVSAEIWANWSIEFTATEFGRDTAATTLINAVSNTTGVYSPVLTVGGSAPLQPLLISVTASAVPNPSPGKTITVTTAAGLALAITRNWVNADVLLIDESTYAVTVNGVAVDFTGYFPSLAPSASTQTLAISNNFTSRTLLYTISYIKRYL